MSIVNSVSTSATDLLAGKAESLQNGARGPHQSEQVGRQFESIFVSLLLKEMRQSIGDGGLFGGDSSDVFGGMFDLYMGDHIASSTSLGVADMITKQLEKYNDVQNNEDARNNQDAKRNNV